jgi:hypothetical protein
MTTNCIKFTSADIGKAANQDDLSLQAVIPWGPKDAA